MPVKSVPTLGWTRGSVAATILLVTQQQRDALAERVRGEMEKRGWNNPKLARETGLSEKTISRVINGRKDPRLDTIERIAKAFEVSEQELRGAPLAPLGLSASRNGGEPQPLERVVDLLVEIRDLIAAIRDFQQPAITREQWADVVLSALMSAQDRAGTERVPRPAPSRDRRASSG